MHTPLVCFTPGPFVQCAIGDACGDGIECVVGLASNIVAFAARSIGLRIRAMCVAMYYDECDAVTTTQTGALDWPTWTTYAVEQSAVMFRPRGALKPWGYMHPFSPQLWVAISILVAVVTPIVAAIVQYDATGNKTVFQTIGTFFPDVFHAHADVDTFDRNNMAFSWDTALLSVTISLITKIGIALYACNLAAYVIFSDFDDSGSLPPTFSSVATTRDYAATRVTGPLWIFDSTRDAFESYSSGKSDALLGSNVVLGSLKTCDDRIRVVDGPRTFDVIAFSERSSFERAVRNVSIALDAVSRTRDAACVAEAQSITLYETFGMFVTFVACMAFVALLAVVTYATRHREMCSKTRRPESPTSLPESIHP